MASVWSAVCRRDPQEKSQLDARIFEMARAPGRGVREDQQQDALPMAGRDHEGKVLESFVTKRRDRKAALKFLRKTMKRHGRPHILVTDMLRSYGAALKVTGNVNKQETGRWLNNRPGNSHQRFRRRERAMFRFRRMRTLQKFVAVPASVHNHFNQECHLYSRSNFKLNRAAALTEWRSLCAP